MLVGGAISWFSRAQKLTASATSESEYIALAEATNELRFLRQVKQFISPPANTRIPIHEDNQGAKKLRMTALVAEGPDTSMSNTT